MRLSDAFSGSSSSCQTPFSKTDCSSAFFAVMKVRRSSTVMRDSFKSATLSFSFFKGRVAAIQTSEGEFSMEPEVDLLIFFLRFMCGILSSWAASLVSGNNVSLRSQNARYLKSKKQPLTATCSHSSGRKWLQLAARASGRKWPQVAASGRKWPHVAASGRTWPHVAARGCTWPVALLVGFEISRAASLAAICIICSHLQPLSATRVAASGRKWPQVAASGRKWLQVAAWTANTSPNGPTLENLKKNAFLANGIFSSFLWNVRWELKRKERKNK